MLAAVMLSAGASTTCAVGLVYVDGRTGSTFGEPPNIFRSNGTSLGTPAATDAVTSETRLNTDNAWGWRDFGATNIYYDPTPSVVDLDYTSIYESFDENAPELQMRLVGGAANGNGGTLNIAANTAYDVYIAYWSDIGTNWGIRAGLQPGTPEAPLPAFGNFNTTIAGETAGRFASSAAWTTNPLDNPTDDNTGTPGQDGGPSDNNANPFLDVTPGGPANSARNMLLGFLGTVTSGSQPGAAANEIRVWFDDLPSAGSGGNRRTWFDGLAFVPAGTNVFWTAELNRTSRSLTVRNETSESFTIAGYSILSAAGSLNGSGVNNAPWNNLTAGTLPNFTDTDNDWAVIGTPAAYSTELREQDGGVGGQNGIVVAPGGELQLGALWQLAPFQDVQVVLRLADATPGTFDDNPAVTIFPTYTGTAAIRGDFTGDGVINHLDYISLMQNLHRPQGTLLRTQYYRNGDFNDDNLVNRSDFFLFRTAYFQANPGAGQGGFDAMIALASQIMNGRTVPEPSTWWLALLGAAILRAQSRRRSHGSRDDNLKDSTSMIGYQGFHSLKRTAVIAFVIGTCFASAAQAVPVVGWQRDALIGNDAVITNANTNSPTIGTGANNSADDVTIWGSTPSNVVLTDGFEAVLSGRVRFIGADPANGRDFRWGMWKRANNGAPQPTGAWLGYLAAGGSGGTPGRLYVRNPDNADFSTASFISTFGDTSIGTASGPAPNGCSPLTDYTCTGTSAGRYFLLSETPVTNNATLNLGTAGNEIWYNFEIRVGRYGDEVTSSGRLFSDAQPAVGDYNNDGRVDAGDYVRWRNNLGGPVSALQNRNPTNLATTIDASHYSDWKANYGNTGSGPAFDLRLGGGLDFNGNPPPAIDPNTMLPNNYTPHLTFEFDRVGFLLGNQMNADQVQFQNIDISTHQIQTINLHVNTATGAVHMRNLLGTPFQINYYEITSTNGVLNFGNWQSFDAADGGLPVTNDYLTGWDVAEGSSNFVLSEGNFVGSTTVTMGNPIFLGNVFNTSTPAQNRDIRFFVGLTNGDVVRGTVIYDTNPPGSGGLAVPEPASVWLLLAPGYVWAANVRRRRSNR